ncbi:MAG: CPBP family intramembrane metalloprotease [Candidatus Pacebacteria bacterium]|nr:CPBP family intramembrane metalloprotease [Candidatus Paceibacterota bacterium]
MSALLPVIVAGTSALLLVVFVMRQFTSLPQLVQFWLGVLPIHGVAFGTCLVILAANVPSGRRLKALDLLPLPSEPKHFFKVSLGILLVVYPMSILLTYLAMKGLHWVGYESPIPPIIDFLAGEPSALTLISVTVVGVLIAPVAEEVLFRLVLYECLLRSPLVAPGVVTSMLFALLHETPVQMPALFVLGMVLQYARRRTGTLWAPIVLHAMYNGASMVFLLLAGTDLPSGPQ